MERAQYIRFKKDHFPMSPGRGGNEISKAMVILDPKAAPPTLQAYEIMDDIIVGDCWVALRKRVKGLDGKFYTATRIVPRDSVRDYEPLEDRKKKETAPE